MGGTGGFGCLFRVRSADGGGCVINILGFRSLVSLGFVFIVGSVGWGETICQYSCIDDVRLDRWIAILALTNGTIRKGGWTDANTLEDCARCAGYDHGTQRE